jgi:hypothetical protein
MRYVRNYNENPRFTEGRKWDFLLSLKLILHLEDSEFIAAVKETSSDDTVKVKK